MGDWADKKKYTLPTKNSSSTHHLGSPWNNAQSVTFFSTQVSYDDKGCVWLRQHFAGGRGTSISACISVLRILNASVAQKLFIVDVTCGPGTPLLLPYEPWSCLAPPRRREVVVEDGYTLGGFAEARRNGGECQTAARAAAAASRQDEARRTVDEARKKKQAESNKRKAVVAKERKKNERGGSKASSGDCGGRVGPSKGKCSTPASSSSNPRPRSSGAAAVSSTWPSTRGGKDGRSAILSHGKNPPRGRGGGGGSGGPASDAIDLCGSSSSGGGNSNVGDSSRGGSGCENTDGGRVSGAGLVARPRRQGIVDRRSQPSSASAGAASVGCGLTSPVRRVRRSAEIVLPVSASAEGRRFDAASKTRGGGAAAATKAPSPWGKQSANRQNPALPSRLPLPKTGSSNLAGAASATPTTPPSIASKRAKSASPTPLAATSSSSIAKKFKPIAGGERDSDCDIDVYDA